MPDHAFAWVLGAGASRASGIPTASELVQRWLVEIYTRMDRGGLTLEQWANAENLGIKGFEFKLATSFYSQIYLTRFRNYPDEGYAYLEDIMAGRDPSPGYSILAKLMEDTRHRVAITTNFDNLIADALSIYTATYPFVCGHESLTSYARVSMRRPLVCKIHRDLLLSPKNDPRSLRRLHDSWGNVIRSMLTHFTPIFIGYGGNDDSLMDLLESLDPGEIRGQPLWCYYEKHFPSERIVDLMKQHKGILIPVPDFDLLMVLIGNEMGVRALDEVLEKRAKARTEKYRKQILGLDTLAHPAAAAALRETLDRAGGPLAWVLKAKNETDKKKSEALYQQGLELFPRPLMYNFAGIYYSSLNQFDKSEELHRKAYRSDSDDASYAYNLGSLLLRMDKNYDEAEMLLRRAVRLASDTATRAISIAGLAGLLCLKRQKYEESEQLFIESLELQPESSSTRLGYSWLLIVLQRFAEARQELESGWATNRDDGWSGSVRLAAKMALFAGLLLRIDDQDADQPLGILKSILSQDFVRFPQKTDIMLEPVRKKIQPSDAKLFEALWLAIGDKSAIALLDKIDGWSSIKPLSISSQIFP